MCGLFYLNNIDDMISQSENVNDWEPALDFSFMEVTDIAGTPHTWSSDCQLFFSWIEPLRHVTPQTHTTPHHTELAIEEPRRGQKHHADSESSATATATASAANTTPSATSKKPRCCAVRLSNNRIESLARLEEALQEVVQRPHQLGWIDLSFNQLSTLDEVRVVRRGEVVGGWV